MSSQLHSSEREELSLDEILGKYEGDGGLEGGHRNPFKFLDSYGPEDQDIFFGRETEIEETVRHFFRRKHFVLYGESGSGKTSLVQCGLRSRIASEDAEFITIRSHSDPLRLLRNALLQHLDRRDGSYDIKELIQAWSERESRTLVLLFDQFEELFIYHSRQIRHHLAAELQRLITTRLDLKIIFIIRQEYLAFLTELERQVPTLFENRLWLRRMSNEDARGAVEAACGVCGVDIEEGLVQAMVHRLSTEGKGVELPYLQVVMDRLYRKALAMDQEHCRITAASYEEEGKIEDILGRFLEEEVEKLDVPNQGRQLLKALVTSEGTKKVVTRQDLATDVQDYGDPISVKTLDNILRLLVDSRILREDPQRDVIEMRHDTLAASVFEWMSYLEKELMEIRQSLSNRHMEYLARGKDDSALLDGGFLRYLLPFEGRLRLSQNISDFVAHSRSKVEHQRRRKRRLMVGGFATAFGLLLAFTLWNIAERARASFLAMELFVGKLDVQLARLADVRPELATLIALHGFGLVESEGEDDKARMASRLRELVNKLPGRGLGKMPAAVDGVLIDRAGDRYVSYIRKGLIWVWDETLRSPMQKRELSIDSGIQAASLSEDGRWLAVASLNNSVWLWDLTDAGKPPEQLLGHWTLVYDLAFSPDGKWLATASGDYTLKLWSLKDDGISRQQVTLAGGNGVVQQVAFSRNGRWLASAGLDGSFRLWDWSAAVEGQGASLVITTPEPLVGLQFDDSGRWLVSRGDKGHTTLWQLFEDNGDIKIRSALSLEQGIRGIRIAKNGGWFAAALEDGSTQLYRLAESGAPKLHQVLAGREGGVSEVRMGPDGEWLIVAGGDSRLWKWQRSPEGDFQEEALVGSHDAPLTVIDADVNGSKIVSGAQDGGVRLFSASQFAKERQDLRLTGATAVVSALSFSPDGKQIAGGMENGAVRVWSLDELAAQGSPSSRLLGTHNGRVKDIGFLGGGNILISREEGRAPWRWSFENGEDFNAMPPAMRFGEPQSMALIMGPSGRWMFSLDRLGRPRLWEIDRRKQEFVERDLKGYGIRARHALFSPDGRRLVFYGWNRHVWMLTLGNASALNDLAILEAHRDIVSHVHFNSSGQRLLTRDIKGRAVLWRLTANGSAVELAGIDLPGTSYALHPKDDTILVIPSERSQANLIHLDGITGKFDSKALYGMPEDIKRVQFSPDGQHLLAHTKSGQLLHWMLFDSKSAPTLLVDDLGPGDEIAFSDNSRWLSLAGRNMRGLGVRLWSISNDRPPNLVSNLDASVYGGRSLFSPDGNWVLIFGDARLPALARLVEGIPRFHGLPVRCSSVVAAAFDKDNPRLSTLSADGTLRDWDLSSDAPWNIPAELAVADDIDGFGILPSSTNLLTIASGQMALLDTGNNGNSCVNQLSEQGVTLSTNSGSRIPYFFPTGDGREAIFMKPTGQGIKWAMGSNGESFSLEPVELLKQAGEGGIFSEFMRNLADSLLSQGEEADKSREYEMAMSENGSIAASLEANNRLSLWRPSDNGVSFRMVKNLPLQHGVEITALELSPSGQWLALGFSSGKLGLFDLEAHGDSFGMQTLTGHSKGISALRFSPDEQYLASGAQDHTIHLWGLDLAALRHKACLAIGRDLNPDEWEQYFSDMEFVPQCPGTGMDAVSFHGGGQ